MQVGFFNKNTKDPGLTLTFGFILGKLIKVLQNLCEIFYVCKLTLLLKDTFITYKKNTIILLLLKSFKARNVEIMNC